MTRRAREGKQNVVFSQGHHFRAGGALWTVPRLAKKHNCHFRVAAPSEIFLFTPPLRCLQALPPTREQSPGRPNAPWVGYGGTRGQIKGCLRPGTPLPRWLSTLGASETVLSVQVCFGGRTGCIFGSSGLYFTYFAALCDCLPNTKSSEIPALTKRRETQLQKKCFKHVRTTFLGQLRCREDGRNE